MKISKIVNLENTGENIPSAIIFVNLIPIIAETAIAVHYKHSSTCCVRCEVNKIFIVNFMRSVVHNNMRIVNTLYATTTIPQDYVHSSSRALMGDHEKNMQKKNPPVPLRSYR